MIKDGILLIRWETGHMELKVDLFFPCAVERFKELLKVIELDWEHRDDILEQLKVYFSEKAREHEELRSTCGKIYWDNKQLQADTERKIESGKHPNGVRLTVKEIAQAKEKLKEYKREVKAALSLFKKCERDKKRYERYIKILE